MSDCDCLTREVQCWVVIDLHEPDQSARMNFVSVSRREGEVPFSNKSTDVHLVVQMQLQILDTRMTDYRISARRGNRVLWILLFERRRQKAES